MNEDDVLVKEWLKTATPGTIIEGKRSGGRYQVTEGRDLEKVNLKGPGVDSAKYNYIANYRISTPPRSFRYQKGDRLLFGSLLADVTDLQTGRDAYLVKFFDNKDRTTLLDRALVELHAEHVIPGVEEQCASLTLGDKVTITYVHGEAHQYTYIGANERFVAVIPEGRITTVTPPLSEVQTIRRTNN